MSASPAAPAFAPIDARSAADIPWESAEQAPPSLHPTDLVSPFPGVRGLFFEGASFRGRPTRVFAWLGVPAAAEPVPGVILLHGGLGTAFADWVKQWNDRSYAAIALDTCGCLPEPADANPRPRHAHAGPAGWGGFAEAEAPCGDHWAYHAVTAAIRAHALLRSLPGVDPARIGVTGVSWGGFLACILAGADPLLAFAAPVYGCGHIGQTVFAGELQGLPPSASARWLALWDPVHHLPRARLPLLWANGTNDAFFFPEPWQASHRLAPGPTTLALIPGLPHDQDTGSTLPEVAAFADAVVLGRPPLARLSAPAIDSGRLTARFISPLPPARAEFVYTIDDHSPWPARRWQSTPARLHADHVDAELPASARFGYFHLTDAQGRRTSSPFATLPRA